tara:strand:- start:2240 stop:2494 length:255 start_codon:yes stop_codon:yes gene_type:complete
MTPGATSSIFETASRSVATPAPNLSRTCREARAAMFTTAIDTLGSGNFPARVQRANDDGILTVGGGCGRFHVDFDTQVSVGSAR